MDAENWLCQKQFLIFPQRSLNHELLYFIMAARVEGSSRAYKNEQPIVILLPLLEAHPLHSPILVSCSSRIVDVGR